MAIIKHLKRLGNTIRGARTGRICTFDKDGNVIDSDVTLTRVPTTPGASNVGKFWGATGASAVGWTAVRQVPAITEGDEGKILIVNEQCDAQWIQLSVDISDQILATENTTVTKYAYLTGNIVVLLLKIANSGETEIAANTTLATLAVYRPPLNLRGSSNRGSSNITTLGDITISAAIPAGSDATVQLTYPIA